MQLKFWILSGCLNFCPFRTFRLNERMRRVVKSSNSYTCFLLFSVSSFFFLCNENSVIKIRFDKMILYMYAWKFLHAVMDSPQFSAIVIIFVINMFKYLLWLVTVNLLLCCIRFVTSSILYIHPQLTVTE